MSSLPEIKERLDNLTRLGNRMKEQVTGLSGPEGGDIKKKAKEAGTRMGIGAGMSFLGLAVAAVALVYSLAVVILLVNLALDRLWLSALIVVGGFLIIGGVILAIGVELARSSAKELSKTTGDITSRLKTTGEEMKAEVDELQKVVKREAGGRQHQVTEMVEKAKKAAPTAAPVVVGAYLGYRILRRKIRSRREKRAILRVIESYEEARTREE